MPDGGVGWAEALRGDHQANQAGLMKVRKSQSEVWEVGDPCGLGCLPLNVQPDQLNLS